MNEEAQIFLPTKNMTELFDYCPKKKAKFNHDDKKETIFNSLDFA